MAHYELKTSPLTSEEKTWCKKLEKLLLSTPDRLGLYTIGDRDLHVFDEAEATRTGLDIADCAASSAGLVLERIKCRVNIHSLAGYR